MGLSSVLQRPLPDIYSTLYNSPAKRDNLSFLVWGFESWLFLRAVVPKLYLYMLTQLTRLKASVANSYFLAFGRLAPYLERRWVRLATPAVSSVPRTM